ncbi:hypothetical protein LCGC14_2613380 [marine sediment metagenome]|uniref:Uncharacterized protein n=1 Tax=marine sediment metagenome TaxID=412755 RepID=A0A0F9ASY2_9ZZZZ
MLKIRNIENKKGQLNTLAPAILALVFAAIVLVFGLVITQSLRDTQTSGTEAFEAANKTVVGLGTFADFWEIIVLAVVIAVVIGLLLVIFGGTTGRRR